MTTSFERDAGGLHVAGLRTGTRGGLPVLALHGWLDNAASFVPLAAQLPELDWALADLPGHGLSDHLPADAAYTTPQAIVQAAVPHCITLTMQEGSDSHVVTISDLTGSEGRILPPWLVEAVTKRGAKDERWDAIEVLYATAALASLPPVKLISLELDVPERTAGDWIQKSRAAGRLLGLKSNVGRPAGES